MHVVVQRMVDARAAGVVFTADPATGRRDLMVIDAIAGLGDALVDGSAVSDHLVVTSDGTQAVREVGDAPVLSDEEVADIRAGAMLAAQHWGRPMDLEWAIDQAGQLWWLQARPITTLPGDLNEMDTPLAGPAHVYTRCNIGEMMPGAFCPLTASVSGHAIDYAMQMTQVVARAQERYDKPWLQVGYFYGHMFLNMTEGTALSSGILGNSLEQFSMSICGRVVDEFEPKPPKPFFPKLINTVRLSSYSLFAGPAIRRLGDQIAAFPIPTGRDAETGSAAAGVGRRAVLPRHAGPRPILVTGGGRRERPRELPGAHCRQGRSRRERGSSRGGQTDGGCHRRRERRDGSGTARGGAGRSPPTPLPPNCSSPATPSEAVTGLRTADSPPRKRCDSS